MHERKPTQRQNKTVLALGRVKEIKEAYKLTDGEVQMLRIYRDCKHDMYACAEEHGVQESSFCSSLHVLKSKTGLPLSAFDNLVDAMESDSPPRYKELSEVLECHRCASIYSSTRFPFYPHDRRCVECIDLESISQAKKRREYLVHQLMDKISRAAKRGHSATPNIVKLISSFNEKIGGISRIGKLWAEHLEILLERSPGSKLALDQLREYAKFHYDISKAQKEKEPSDMTDDELQSYEASLVVEQMTQMSSDMFQELARVYLNSGVVKDADYKQAAHIPAKPSLDGKGNAAEGSLESLRTYVPDTGESSHVESEGTTGQGRQTQRQEHGSGHRVCQPGVGEEAVLDGEEENGPAVADAKED